MKSMQICWLTDVHLNLLSQQQRASFYQQLLKKPIDALLLTGDIAQGSSTLVVLAELAEISHQLNCSIYFVLGNHDYFDHVDNCTYISWIDYMRCSLDWNREIDKRVVGHI